MHLVVYDKSTRGAYCICMYRTDTIPGSELGWWFVATNLYSVLCSMQVEPIRKWNIDPAEF